MVCIWLAVVHFSSPSISTLVNLHFVLIQTGWSASLRQTTHSVWVMQTTSSVMSAHTHNSHDLMWWNWELDKHPHWRVITYINPSVFICDCFIALCLWLFMCSSLFSRLCVCGAAGVFAFGLFATDIFVNAGQVVTGGLSPYFLSVCKPNYTGTECRFNHQFIVNGNICTGNHVVVEKARRSFPSKDASLSVYSAVYLTVRGPHLILYFRDKKRLEKTFYKTYI